MKLKNLLFAGLLATAAISVQAQYVEDRAYYSTNANEAVGEAATITIDGEFSDW